MTKTVIAKFAFWTVFFAALMFLPARTLDWPGAWLFLAEFVLLTGLMTAWLARHNPALLRERVAGPLQKGQVFWDRVFTIVTVVAWCAWIVLMAYDVKRWKLSYMPDQAMWIGAGLMLATYFIMWLVFRANSFASPVVRIQDERQQTVITTGPYRVVRHPMYAGVCLYVIAIPLMLGSWLGLACAPLFVIGFVLRIFIEERALRRGLPGYDDYMARVRWRLMPGVW